MSLTLEQEYDKLRAELAFAMHELPAGVCGLWQGAGEAQCAAMLDALERMVELCKALDLQADDFIAACRWHLNHYPDYLAAHQTSGSYPEYVRDSRGPLRVPPAPAAAP